MADRNVSVSLHFSEWGSSAQPDVEHFQSFYPGSTATIRREGEMPELPELKPEHPRYGMRRRNLEQIRQLLGSQADVAIALDSDMRIVSDLAKDLPTMALKFGLCVPANPRELILVDTRKGVDSDGRLDGARAGMAVNYSPIAFATADARARRLLQEAERVMLERPTRGTLLIPHAEWRTGIHAYRLPRQWCVCQEDTSIGNEIMLHIGHGRVQKHYGERYR